MKKPDSLYRLREDLRKVFQTSQDVLYEIQQKCVKDNRFTFSEIVKITHKNTSLESLSRQQLFWLLEYSNKHISSLGKVEDYFTPVEIKNYRFYTTNETKSIGFPVVFEGVTPLTPILGDGCIQFSFHLTVEQIAAYKANRIFEVVPELQRGGHEDRYGNLKTRVNPKRRREITELIQEGRFFYNAISLTLLDVGDVDWRFNKEEETLTIEKGTLIVPDGNHRAVACEFVDGGNIHKNDKFVILFTVLSQDETKRKIFQEWNTEPVNKTHMRYMKPSAANKIVDSIKRSHDIDELIRANIVTMNLQVHYGEGFIIHSVLSDAIEKYYNAKEMKTKIEQDEITVWLTDFFNRIVYIFKEDFPNYKEVKKTQWNVSPYAFVGYVMLSKFLMGKENWKEELTSLLKQIDFTNTDEFKGRTSKRACIKHVEKVFGEVIKDGNEQGNV